MDDFRSRADLTPLRPRTILGPSRAPGAASDSISRTGGPAMASVRSQHPAAKARPNATAMRAALGGGGLAILSAVAAAIVAPPAPAVSAPAAQFGAQAAGTPQQIQRPVKYVQLLPGESAPPGATVIDPAAPTPMTVITTIPAPAQKPIIIKTTQSGKVVK